MGGQDAQSGVGRTPLLILLLLLVVLLSTLSTFLCGKAGRKVQVQHGESREGLRDVVLVLEAKKSDEDRIWRRVKQKRTKTGGTERFKLPREYEVFQLVARKRDFTSETVPIDPADKGVIQIRLFPVREFRMTVSVIDSATTEPIAGARVALKGRASMRDMRYERLYDAETGDDGRAVVVGKTGHVDYLVTASQADYEVFSDTLEQPPDDYLIHLRPLVTPPPLLANFTYRKWQGDVSFTDRSQGEVHHRSWDFGDGSPTTSMTNPTHRYEDPGTYTVSLTINGPKGTDRRNMVIRIPPPGLEADFETGTATSGRAPLEVRFVDKSRGEVTSWEWNFGDGETSIQENPSHEYEVPDDYDVSLRVYGPTGTDQRVRSGLIHVDPPGHPIDHTDTTTFEPIAPVASFTSDRTRAYEGTKVRFQDLSTGPVTTWEWDFGDGTGSSERSPSHEYEKAETYTVMLTVRGPGGSDQFARNDYILVRPWNPSDDLIVTMDSLVAFGDYERMISLNPGDLDGERLAIFKYYQGKAFYMLDRYEEALAVFLELVSGHTLQAGPAAIAKGTVLDAMGERLRAIYAYKEALTLNLTTAERCRAEARLARDHWILAKLSPGPESGLFQYYARKARDYCEDAVDCCAKMDWSCEGQMRLLEAIERGLGE